MVTFYFRTGETELGVMLTPLLIVFLRVRERVLATVKLLMIMTMPRLTVGSMVSLKELVKQTKFVDWDD